MQLKILLLLGVLWSLEESTFGYTIPNVQLEITNNGFRVFIPDAPGIKYVAFNINRNREFKSFEPGEISVQVRQKTGDRWIYEGNRELRNNDVIYVWTNVQHNKLVYRTISNPIYVNELQNEVTSAKTETEIKPVTAAPDTTGVEGECQPSITEVKNRQVCKGQLIFEDHFDNGLNETLWKTEVYIAPDSGDAEFVFYDDSRVSVKNGKLKIKPQLWTQYRNDISIRKGTLDVGSRCTSMQIRECNRKTSSGIQILPPIVSGRINTKNSFSFKYGRVEIKAKIGIGDWLFPLILLEPLTNEYGSSLYESGQLRIAFARGNRNLNNGVGDNIGGSTLYGGAILNKEPSKRESSFVKTTGSTHFGDGYHIYSMIWTDEKITFKVDGQHYGDLNGGFDKLYPENENLSNGGKLAPFDKEFYITLGVSGGGHGDFPDDSISNGNSKPWINSSPRAANEFWKSRDTWRTTWTSPSLDIDYVGVYAI